MGQRRHFRALAWMVAGNAGLLSCPALANGARDPLVDMFFQPLRDVRLMAPAIPPRLLAILSTPYSLDRLHTCTHMAWEVDQLDAILPRDVGYGPMRRNLSDRMIGQGRSMIGGLIPFRGLVREVSGANDADRRLAYAVRVGEARRSFLMGVGLARGCAPPAAPPLPRLIYVLAGL
ncbi:MAG: hypothetical protein ABW039_01085 [Sphingobium sp.]